MQNNFVEMARARHHANLEWRDSHKSSELRAMYVKAMLHNSASLKVWLKEFCDVDLKSCIHILSSLTL